jgi:hypothetical protein
MSPTKRQPWGCLFVGDDGQRLKLCARNFLVPTPGLLFTTISKATLKELMDEFVFVVG